LLIDDTKFRFSSSLSPVNPPILVVTTPEAEIAVKYPVEPAMIA